ncbi:MAG: ATP-dependent Zn protease [Coleofasciculaceae cyanobacterium]
MQQTALNLVAIGIFALTLSALLGPMLNISPTIPALTTLGVLSLLTFDTFRFQGKGGTILLDWLSGAAHRDRIIHHEAGHFLVAYFLGIPITGYTLTAWEAFKQGQPGLGGVEVDAKTISQDLPVGEMRLNLERCCTVWMAGIAAETIVYGSANGGLEDRQKVREAVVSLGRPQSEFELKERSCTRQAQTMIKEHWESYQALVAAMEKRATVDECCLVIQQHCQS